MLGSSVCLIMMGCGSPADSNLEAQGFENMDSTVSSMSTPTLPFNSNDMYPSMDHNTYDAFIDTSSDGMMTIDHDLLIPKAGGDTTHQTVGIGSYVQPAANLSLRRRGNFEAGLQFFQLVWEPYPNRSEIDGLGPTYNAKSCVACHQRNGRGGTPLDNSPGVLLRLGNDLGMIDPTYGNQLQNFSISGVRSEGRVGASLGTPIRHFSGVSLTTIRYTADSLAFGPLASNIKISARITPQLVGMGLIDAIIDSDLVALEDPNDFNGDGISGRAARDQSGVLRFGWKSSQRSVLTQCASAFFNDMGITNLIHPDENCPHSQVDCQAWSSPMLDIDEIRLQATATYLSLLGVPAHRHSSAASYYKGASLFEDIGCADCHQPDFITGQSSEPELSTQHIWPYSDFLLHNMGPALNDGVAEGDAMPDEWRTPPLWGLGLLVEVNGKYNLMHDGRATSIEEAILWHGGEAENSVFAFESLDPIQRAELIDFVRAL